jgi:hypothetical protein
MGDYEQLSPFYSTKLVIEADGIEVDVKAEYERIREDIDFLLRVNVENIKNAKKAKEIGNFRFYERNGMKYVSVTSVLNPEPKTPEDEARLRPYGDRGTALHRQFAHLIENARLDSFTTEELQSCASVGGFTGYEFWFNGDKRFDFRLAEVEVYNDTLLYAGRFDAQGFFDGKKAKFDLKSGSLDKAGIEKAFLQLAAYDNCQDPSDVLVIIPIGPKSKKEPIVASGDEIKAYFDKFVGKRKAFKEKYGV